MYDTCNICDCVSQSKLDEFSISVLQDICGSFQLHTSGIGQRRSKPYLEFVVNLVEKCSCKYCYRNSSLRLKDLLVDGRNPCR